jgi:ABC-2 type transport system permease protein
MLRIHLLEVKYEFLKALRLPAHAVPTIAFPLMFYVLFGLAFGAGRVGALGFSAYLLATYGATAVCAASLFGFGVGVATERGQGWMTVKRASPMPLSAYITAKIAVSMLFSLIVILLMFGLGATFGGVRLPWAAWPSLALVLVLGAVPFCALGLTIGYLAGPNAAPGIVNLIFMPMSFASGLWFPYEMLPRVVKSVSPYLPAFHLGRLGLGVLGVQPEQAAGHVAALLGFTLLFVAAAVVAFRRDEGKTYG